MEIHLLDYLAYKSHCACLSDLKFLPTLQRRMLALQIRHIPLESASRKEWNDALQYFRGDKSTLTSKMAKSALILYLSKEHIE